MTDAAPVVVERRIPATPDVVYPYLVEPDLASRWLGLRASIASDVGGDVVMHAPNGHVAAGEVVELVPDRKVAFTWGFRGEDFLPAGSTLVEIELLADGDGTIVRLTHSALATPELRTNHARGWNHYLDRLGIALAGGDPGIDTGA